MKKGISEHCPEETITTEHVPDENEKKAHRSILRYCLTSNDVSYTLSVQNEHFSWPNAGQRIFFDNF